MPEEHRSPPRQTTLHLAYQQALASALAADSTHMLLAFNAGHVLGLIQGAENERGRRQQRASAQSASKHAQSARADRRKEWSQEAFERYERLIKRGTLSRTQVFRLVAKEQKAKKKLQSLSYRTVGREIQRLQKSRHSERFVHDLVICLPLSPAE